MARPRTPTNVLEIRGAYQKDPKRKKDRAGEPIVNEPLGPAPSHLSPEQKKCWKELVKITPKGVLTQADRVHVEMAACLLHEFRLDPVSFPSVKLARLEGIAGKMGLNPSDRTRINIGKPENQDDPWADL